MSTWKSLRFHVVLSLPSFSIWASPPLSMWTALLRTPRLPPCSTSAQLHSLFLSSSSLLLRLFHPLSPVHWPLSKCVFVSPSEAQCVSARWPQANHHQWSTAKTIRQETPLLAVPPLLSFHHLWLCWFSFSILAYDYWIFQTKSSVRTGLASAFHNPQWEHLKYCSFLPPPTQINK